MNKLDQMVQSHGQDIKLFWQDRIDGIKVSSDDWTSWNFYSKCTSKQREESNLRELFDNEIILDLEEKERLEEIETKLQQDKLSYEVWNSRRGFHIHLFFQQMVDCNFEKCVEALNWKPKK